MLALLMSNNRCGHFQEKPFAIGVQAVGSGKAQLATMNAYGRAGLTFYVVVGPRRSSSN
jgi:hypothetical protein